MKSFITPTYIFTPGISGVGTIDLSSIANFDIKRLVAIININSNIIIYNVANPLAGFTTVVDGVITLDYNTSAMSGSDLLQIIYDYEDAMDVINGSHFQKVKLTLGEDSVDGGNLSQENPLPIEALRIEDLLVMMNRLVKVCETLMVVDSAQRQRVTIDAITGGLTLAAVTTISTVSTVTSVTNVAAQTSLAGMDREMYINIAKQTYAQSIRQNLTFQ
jgi:hypothetical protein